MHRPQKFYRNLRSQHGAAIIVALFVMALVATCAVAMMFRLNVDVQRSALILNSDKANLYAQGSIDWAIEQLKADLANQKPGFAVDRLPMMSGTNTVDGYAVTSTVEDMQNKINLNDLQDQTHHENFLRLMHLVLPNLAPENIGTLTQAIVDWTQSANSDPTLINYYQKQANPYQAPHQPMISVSELRLVRGVTPAIYQALLPFVTALPTGTKINVNDAPWQVLSSLSVMSGDVAKAIALQCKQNPFASTQDFLNFDIVKNNSLPGNAIDVVSSYFLVKTSVKVGAQEILIFTMLQRTVAAQGGKPDVKIVWQSKGTL